MPYLKACSSFSCAANTVLKKNAENFAGLVLRFFLLTVCIERRLIFWSEDFLGFGMASFDREWKVIPRMSAAKRPLPRGLDDWHKGSKTGRLSPNQFSTFSSVERVGSGNIHLMPHPLFSKERLEVSCLQSAHCYVKDGRGVYPTEWYLRDLQEAEFCWKPSKSHKQQT